MMVYMKYISITETIPYVLYDVVGIIVVITDIIIITILPYFGIAMPHPPFN